MARTILVTGATGTVGSEVLRLLKGRNGIHVRAAVRDLKKGAALAAPGVETTTFDCVLFDYAKPDTFAAACQGADAIFLVAPFTPAGVGQAQALIAAARVAGVKHIVKLGVSRSLGDITVGRWHAAIDTALNNSGIAWSLLLPGGFMQNFLKNSAPHPDGNMYLPVGDAKASFIDVRDIAEVAVKALTEPGHEGREYTLTGPEDLSYADAAVIMSEVSGRAIRFVDVPEAAARQGMLASGYMPEWLVDVILELNAWFKASGGSEITSTVQDVLGRPPRTFRDFARDYAAHWKL
jgi:uncharacterized protein YbjT (DUF2867 family)